jgi:hypothetical protein
MPATSATRQTLPPPWVISSVVAAVHTAAHAITRIAAGDRESVRAAAADRRLYMSAFTRASAAVVRRRYRPASPSRVDEILVSYDHTIEASTRATTKLDKLALALDASTWPLAALHAEPQWVPRGTQPRGASAPDASAIHQSATGASLPGSESECRQSPRPTHWCPCQTAATASPRE